MDFLKGINYLSEGFKLITHRELRRFIFIPLLINLVMFICLLLVAIYWFNDVVTWLQHFLPTWLQWLKWLAWLIAFVALLIFWVYFSTILVNAVAGPFNSLLSEKISQKLIKDQIADRSLLMELPLAIKRESQLILYYIPRAVLYLLFFLIPVVQFFAAFIWFCFNAWVMSMQYLDYPMDNHRISVKPMKALMGQKKMLNLGFGTGVMLLTMIPLINFVIIPTAVAGATLLWVNEYWPLMKKA